MIPLGRRVDAIRIGCATLAVRATALDEAADAAIQLVQNDALTSQHLILDERETQGVCSRGMRCLG
jgi:hypothetical protein